MQGECQFAANGVSTGGEIDVSDARRTTLEKGITDWQLLLQIDSDDSMETMWGDAGRVYFWIREQDLKNQDFGKVWLSSMLLKGDWNRKAKVMTLWELSDKLKLGKSSAFVKKNLRTLRLTDAEFEADFFCDHRFSEKDGDVWIGVVVERELGAVLALEDVRFRPPTVNDLAAILAHAMLRPLTERGRQRPSIVHLRHRPQWQELLPHLQQLGMRVGLAEELPIFDLVAAEWMYKTRLAARFHEALIEWKVNRKTATEVPMLDELRMTLRKPFPDRRRSVQFRSSDLMHWSHEMCVRAYPSRSVPVPPYTPETIVPVRLNADELEAILTTTVIATSDEL